MILILFVIIIFIYLNFFCSSTLSLLLYSDLPSFPKFTPISDSIHFGAIAGEGDNIASSSSNVNNNVNTLNNDLVSSDPRFDPRISQLLATNALQLAHDIGANLLLDSTEKTEVFSPLSIYGAINLLLLGANGQTFDEIMKFLKFNEGNSIHLFLLS